MIIRRGGDERRPCGIWIVGRAQRQVVGRGGLGLANSKLLKKPGLAIVVVGGQVLRVESLVCLN